jgi:16S rRNA (guanine527-N7)-methyltransferase
VRAREPAGGDDPRPGPLVHVTGLDAVARRFGVSSDGLAALEAILALQAADPEAPTTVREPDAAVDRHVADSLVALELPAVRTARRIVDLGSGAGWPGLALAAALPEARVALVESAVRKCRYLARAVAAAGLANAEVVHARAEEWEAGAGAHDVVTARALASLPVLCEYAAPLLAPGGALVAWKGAVEPGEAAAGDRAAAVLGLAPAAVHAVAPYAAAERRTLHVFRKIGPTPERFPRRPGMAVKRPLGTR